MKVYVAQESFQAEIHGMPFPVTAGHTRLTEDHPLVVRYPKGFRVDEGLEVEGNQGRPGDTT